MLSSILHMNPSLFIHTVVPHRLCLSIQWCHVYCTGVRRDIYTITVAKAGYSYMGSRTCYVETMAVVAVLDRVMDHWARIGLVYSLIGGTVATIAVAVGATGH